MTAKVECRCGECGVEFTAAPEGGHRLLCGDSTVATDVERVLTGITPHLMVTDPPYGVNYDPTWRNAAKFGDGLSHAGRASGKVVNDDRADWREASIADQHRSAVSGPTSENSAVCSRENASSSRRR